MKEAWKEIPNSCGYWVSNQGRVKREAYQQWNCLTHTYSNFPECILKPTVSFGYQYVGIKYQNGETKRQRVHKLVAEAFILNPQGLTQINHIDGHKENNCVSNLEWCSASHNTKHAYRAGLIDLDKFRSINSSQATPYLVIWENGSRSVYGSQREVLKELGVGKTVFKSPAFQRYLLNRGISCKRITKEEYFILESSTTILK